MPPPPKLTAEQGLGPKEELLDAATNAAKAQPTFPLSANPSPSTSAKPEPAKTEVVNAEGVKPESPKAEPAQTPVAEGKDGSARFVVQVGAYADADKAREARRKLEKAGLKTYTHVAETKEGKRTRVRLGPFASREEADKAADKAKQLEFTPAVLSL